MSIIISRNGKKATPVEESKVEDESELQHYIADNPEVIPLDQVKENPEFFVVGVEVDTKSGPVDAIGLDSDGEIYLIETKLEQNSDKREIIAQIFDYAANIWKTDGSTDEFIENLDVKVQELCDMTLQQKIQQDFTLDATEANKVLSTLRNNIDDGYFKFVICMDALNERLKDLILYINYNSKFDIYAVDFEFYRYEDMQIVKPQLYGAEVKKDLATSTSAAKSVYTESTENVFWEYADSHINEGTLDDKRKEVLKRLVNTTKQVAEATKGRIEFRHTKNIDRTVIKLALYDVDEKISWTIDSDGGFYAQPRDKSGAQIDVVNKFTEKLVEGKIAGRNEKHLNDTKWFADIKIGKASNLEAKQFAQSFEQATSEVLGIT
jgi:hypothetical protein